MYHVATEYTNSFVAALCQNGMECLLFVRLIALGLVTIRAQPYSSGERNARNQS